MPEREFHALDDVYGISRDVPLNYVSRPSVDGNFADSLKRGRHIVVHGCSKQGKTSLRRWTLSPGDYLDVTCSDSWTLAALHGAILKEAGYRVEMSSTRSDSESSKATVSLDGRLSIPALGGLGAETSYESAGATARTAVTRPLDLDLADPNDIVRALTDAHSPRLVVLEDFHYLPIETQQHFSFALKTYYERSEILFIVTAVWLDENRITQFNGDLVGRVVDVNADVWTEAELRQVITSGAELLNVTFDDGFTDRLIGAARGSVYLVQEACYRACEYSDVFGTSDELRAIAVDPSPDSLIELVVNESSGRYRGFLSRFAQGFRGTELEMYRWILLPVIEASPETLQNGIPLAAIRDLLSQRHPRRESLNAGSISQALSSIVSLQSKLNIRPTILDFDSTTGRLMIVDRAFAVWLLLQDRRELAASLGLVHGEGTDG